MSPRHPDTFESALANTPACVIWIHSSAPNVSPERAACPGSGAGVFAIMLGLETTANGFLA